MVQASGFENLSQAPDILQVVLVPVRISSLLLNLSPGILTGFGTRVFGHE